MKDDNIMEVKCKNWKELCESHDLLLEACKEAIGVVDDALEEKPLMESQLHRIDDLLTEAINKAEGNNEKKNNR